MCKDSTKKVFNKNIFTALYAVNNIFNLRKRIYNKFIVGISFVCLLTNILYVPLLSVGNKMLCQ